MKRQNTVKRICKNAIMLTLLCILGMLAIPFGANVKVSLQLLMVFIICLTMESVIDCLIITSLYLLLGLFLPFYAGFNIGISQSSWRRESKILNPQKYVLRFNYDLRCNLGKLGIYRCW